MAGAQHQIFSKDVWLKRVLIPFWTLELFIALFLFIMSCLALAYSENWDYTETGRRNLAGDVLGFLGSMMTMGLIIAEIVLFDRSRLAPRLHLIWAVTKAVCWLILLIVMLFTASFIVWVLAVCLFGLTVGQTIYGGVIFHRFRKGKLDHVFDSNSDLGRSSPAPAGSYAAHNPPSTRLESLTSQNPFRDPSPSSRSLATSLNGASAPPAYDPTRVV